MARPRLHSTLEQWRNALAVVQDGGFASAAEALNKSQSSVSHAVRELSERLGVDIFEVVGRKAVATDAGQILLRRAERLLGEAALLEAAAASLAKGFDVELQLAVDVIVPTEIVIDGLNRFAALAPATRVTVRETVLSGTVEALTDGDADIILSGILPAGYFGIHFIDIDFIAVAGPAHPLHRLGRAIGLDDLRPHRQLVIQDSGRRDIDASWLEAEQRWTFSSHASALEALRAGSGFAWAPVKKIEADLASGRLRPLDLIQGGHRRTAVQLVKRDPVAAGPGVDALAEALLEAARDSDNGIEHAAAGE